MAARTCGGTRWNVAKLYRQHLTNCGVRTQDRPSPASSWPLSATPPTRGRDAVAGRPQSLRNPVEAEKVQDVEGAHIKLGTRICLPALGRRLEGDAWLDDPDRAGLAAPRRRQEWLD